MLNFKLTYKAVAGDKKLIRLFLLMQYNTLKNICSLVLHDQ